MWCLYELFVWHLMGLSKNFVNKCNLVGDDNRQLHYCNIFDWIICVHMRNCTSVFPKCIFYRALHEFGRLYSTEIKYYRQQTLSTNISMKKSAGWCYKNFAKLFTFNCYSNRSLLKGFTSKIITLLVNKKSTQ